MPGLFTITGFKAPAAPGSSYDRAARLGAYGQPIEPWSLNYEDKVWYYRAATYAHLGRLEEALSDVSQFVKARPGVSAPLQ